MIAVLEVRLGGKGVDFKEIFFKDTDLIIFLDLILRTIMKNIILYSLVLIQIVVMGSGSLFGLCYSSKTNGEEIHQRACAEVYQATGLFIVEYEDDKVSSGTATLIASDVVITVAHVFNYLLQQNKKIKAVYFHPLCAPVYIDNMGKQPKSIWIHPSYDHGKKNYEMHDIAIVKLAQSFNNIQLAQLQKSLPDDFASANAIVVGYGLFGNNYEGGKFKDLKRRAGDIELFLDYDHQSYLYRPYTSYQDEIGFVDLPEGSKYMAIIESGDSGGPAFIQASDQPMARILGIAMSHFRTNFGKSFVYFVSIPYHYDWIKSVLELCNYKLEDEEESMVFDYNKIKFGSPGYVDMQRRIAWRNFKYVFSLATEKGSEVLGMLYDYAADAENQQAFGEVLGRMSDEGLRLLYEYIEVHKELFAE